MNGQFHHSSSAKSFFALLVMGFGLSTQGATITWTNTSGGNWSATNNWSPNQVPGASDTALITTSGAYTITLNANAQVANFTLGATSGIQKLTVSGSTLSFANGGMVGTNGILNLSGSTLTGLLIVNGALNWTNGGSISGGSSLTVANNAILNIGGGYSASLNGMLTNAGTVNWSGTGNINIYNYALQGSSGGIVNLAGALFNAQNDQTIANNVGSPYFNNAGTFLKSAGTNTTINVIFNNTGVVNLSIYSRNSFGRINLSGNVVLAGVVNINFNNTYAPATGDFFPLVTYGSETGAFSSVNLPASAPWQTNSITYGSTAFSLTVGSIYKLAFTTGPAGTNSAGAVFAPVVVQAQYLNGTPLATNGVPVTMALSSGSGILSGTLTQNTDPTGNATFNNLSMNLVGPKTLLASSPPWITPTSSSVVVITPGPAAQLRLTTPITPLQKQGYTFSPAPTVQVLDPFGNIVSNSTVLITVNSSSSGGGTLGGTTGSNANGISGSAAFSNLHYNLANPTVSESVSVYFTSPGLVPATNSPIQVVFVCGLVTLTNNNSLV